MIKNCCLLHDLSGVQLGWDHERVMFVLRLLEFDCFSWREVHEGDIYTPKRYLGMVLWRHKRLCQRRGVALCVIVVSLMREVCCCLSRVMKATAVVSSYHIR